MIRKLYDFNYEEWLEKAPGWVRDAPGWVQQRLANNDYIAGDPNGWLEVVREDYYLVHARGFCYVCTKHLDWLL